MGLEYHCSLQPELACLTSLILPFYIIPIVQNMADLPTVTISILLKTY